ncbi:MAG: SMC-Scp complex subunit ScpB [Bacteroidota bacterium]
MARYFGGFRDRLKKRSKHVPITIKDVEWVKVATTFSWSPARRDYQWLEPEDYLSSFLSSSTASYETTDDLPDEVHGDGSMDAAMDMPFSSAAYDGSETLIGITSVDDEPPIIEDVVEEEESKIAYVPPFDFVPEPAPTYPEEGVLRPNIDVPAELPLLDEYKLEIVSALQRRGIKIDVNKIKLPEDLIGQLNAYHAGRVSIDSYELRARLQKYKRQVIESYEQFNAVSGPINPEPIRAEIIEIEDVSPDETEIPSGLQKTGDDGTYEEFILSSLNRLEASMNDHETAFDIDADMITPESNGAPNNDVFDEANQTMDFRGSIRTTRHIETPPDTSDILAEGLSGLEGKGAPPEGDLPSSYADDSWLVLPVDSRKAGKDLENPDDLDDPAEQTLTFLKETPATAVPPVAATPPLEQPPALPDVEDDDGRTDSSELLKALNTINSRFPDATIDADALELNTADLLPVPEDDLITPTPSAAPIMQPETPVEIEPELPQEIAQEAPPSAVPPVPSESRVHSEELIGLEQEIPAVEQPEDDTSLSDLLLQLRHEGDRTQRDEHQATQEPVEPPVSEKPPQEEESVEARRARYIEEERKKLYSIIDGLEESAPASQLAADESPQSEAKPVAASEPAFEEPAAPAPAIEPVETKMPASTTLAEKSKLIENILAAKEQMAGGKRRQPAPEPVVPAESMPEQPAPVPLEPVQTAPVQTRPTESLSVQPAPVVAKDAPQVPDVPQPTQPVAAEPAPVEKQEVPVVPPVVAEQPKIEQPEFVPPTVAPPEGLQAKQQPIPPTPVAGNPASDTPVAPPASDSPAADVTPAKRPFGALGLEKLAASPEVFDTSDIDDVFNNHEESLQNESGAISSVSDPVFSSNDDAVDTPLAPVVPTPVLPEEKSVTDPVHTPAASLDVVAETPATPPSAPLGVDVDKQAGDSIQEPVEADAIDDATRGIIADFASLDTGEPELLQKNLEDSGSETVAEPVAPIAPIRVRGADTPDETRQESISEVVAAQKGAEPIRPVSKDTTYMSEPQLTEPTVPELANTPVEAEEQSAAPDAPVASEDAADVAPIVDAATVQEVTVAIEANPESETGKVVPASVKDEGLVEVDEPLAAEIELTHVVESLAFATEDPIPLKKIARIFADTLGLKMPSEKKVRAAVAKLNEAYAADGRTYRIKEWAGGIRMASHPQYAQFIRALYKDNRPKKLSRTLMETLAIIAYSQPSTKPEIDFVRGVDSDYAVRKLLELGLIDIVGRSESIGRPLLYGTSERFLEQFGLSEIGALPKLREVEDLLGDPSFKKERLQLLALDEMDTAGSDADASTAEASNASTTPAENPAPASTPVVPDAEMPASPDKGQPAA